MNLQTYFAVTIVAFALLTAACKKPKQTGCKNHHAENYDPEAMVDDGSCIIRGCTNSHAENYNSEATVDDGNCILCSCVREEDDNHEENASCSGSKSCDPQATLGKFVGNYQVEESGSSPYTMSLRNPDFFAYTVEISNLGNLGGVCILQVQKSNLTLFSECYQAISLHRDNNKLVGNYSANGYNHPIVATRF